MTELLYLPDADDVTEFTATVIEATDSDYCRSVPGRPHSVVRSYR
jgi:hypothetical protein